MDSVYDELLFGLMYIPPPSNVQEKKGLDINVRHPDRQRDPGLEELRSQSVDLKYIEQRRPGLKARKWQWRAKENEQRREAPWVQLPPVLQLMLKLRQEDSPPFGGGGFWWKVETRLAQPPINRRCLNLLYKWLCLVEQTPSIFIESPATSPAKTMCTLTIYGYYKKFYEAELSKRLEKPSTMTFKAHNVPSDTPEPHLEVSEPSAAVPPFARRPHRRFDQKPTALPEPHLEVSELFAAVLPFPCRLHRQFDQSYIWVRAPEKLPTSSMPSEAFRVVPIADSIRAMSGLESWKRPSALPEPHLEVSEPFAAVPPLPRRPHRQFDQSYVWVRVLEKFLQKTSSRGPGGLRRCHAIPAPSPSLIRSKLCPGLESWKITRLELPDLGDAVRGVSRCPHR
ncbi:hypothetical protein B0H11DRAFT_2382365 [Mycena galericulata]|nr:hypothetical protein B0H11DRAFT_2382365 [Mycena galericulata]